MAKPQPAMLVQENEEESGDLQTMTKKVRCAYCGSKDHTQPKRFCMICDKSLHYIPVGQRHKPCMSDAFYHEGCCAN